MKNFLTELLLILKKIIIIILKLLFCLFFTIMAGYSIALIGTLGYADTKSLDWQVIFYITLGIFSILGAWVNSFFKTPIKIKLLFIILFLIWLFSPRILPSVMRQFDYDIYVDTGICAEGIKLKDGVMSKEYCLKHKHIWDERNRSCNMYSKNK